MSVDDSAAVLAGTWFYTPVEPHCVDGYPLACPACGGRDQIQYWLHYRADVVKAKHVCVPSDGRRGATVRDWDEHRISPEFLREHGRTIEI